MAPSWSCGSGPMAGQVLHLTVQLEAVVARLGTEHAGTSGNSGFLMLPFREPPVPFWRCSRWVELRSRLLQRLVGARTAVGQVLLHVQPDGMVVRLDAEDGVAELGLLPVDFPSVPSISSSILLPDLSRDRLWGRERPQEHEIIRFLSLSTLSTFRFSVIPLLPPGVAAMRMP